MRSSVATSRIAIAATVLLACAAAGCASGPIAPGHPEYPASAASWTIAIAAAGSPADLAEALTRRVEAAVAEIRSIPTADTANGEAASRALNRIIREALAPTLRSLALSGDVDDEFIVFLLARLARQAGLIENEASYRELPALRKAAVSLRSAVSEIEKERGR